MLTFIVVISLALLQAAIADTTDNGCLTPDGTRLEDGETFQKEPNVWQCQKTKLTAIACYKSGRTLAPSQTLQDGVVYYTCQQTNDGFELKAVGCIHLPSTKVPVGETAQVKEYLFKCVVGKEGDKLPEFVPYACLFQKAQLVIGEKAQDDLYWYECKEVNKKGIQLEVKGCMSDGMRLKDGEVFHSNGFMYRCVDAGSVIKRLGVGCLEMTPEHNLIEHAIGDKWADGNDKAKVLVQCIFNGATVAKKQLQCRFTDDDGKELLLDANCMARTKNFLHQCVKTTNDSNLLLPKSIDNPTDSDVKDAQRNGFQICN